jgi:3-oxoacyl-(acyl-carrier-protein) synthase
MSDGPRDKPAPVVLTGIGSTALRQVGIGRCARYLDGDGAVSAEPPDDVLLAELCDAFAPAASRDFARMDPMAWHALLAARLAMSDAGLPVPDDVHGNTGVIVGTALGSLESDLQYSKGLLVGQPPSAVLFRHTSANIPATQMAKWLGCRGVNITIASGIVAGLQALAYGCDLIRQGSAERVLCGAVEWTGPTVTDVLRQTRLYPAVSQGAAVLVLESLRSVERRGGTIYAEVKTCDIVYGRRSKSAHPDQPLRGTQAHIAPWATREDRPPDGSALFGVISLLDRISSLPAAASGTVRHAVVLDGSSVETVLRHDIAPAPPASEHRATARSTHASRS